jgi:hypothetical protein
MKTLLPALCLCVVPMMAAPAACVTGTYASYEALASGCSIDDAVFSNFSTLSFVNTLVAQLPASQILVIPSGTLTDVFLTFEYLNAAGAPSAVSLSSAGQIFSMGFNYQITVSPSKLSSIQMDSTFSNTAPGSVSATKTAQLLGGGPTYTSTVSDNGVSNVLGTQTGTVMPVAGTGTFVITDTTSLQAQTGAVAQSNFANSFVLSPATNTPEVQSLAMIGSGLVFLGLISASTRKKGQKAEK